MITGDVAKHCGWRTYPSMTEVDIENKGPYNPKCVWIDGNNSYGRGMPQSIFFHIRDFDGRSNETMEAYKNDKRILCDVAPRMSKFMQIPEMVPVFKNPLQYQTEIGENTPNNIDLKFLQDQKNWKWVARDCHVPHAGSFWDPPSEPDNVCVGKHPRFGEKRSDEAQTLRKDRGRYETALVAAGGDDPDYSAEELCKNPTTWGPDIVNLDEDKFCDLSLVPATGRPTAKLWDVCSDIMPFACFDPVIASFRGYDTGNETSVQARGERPPLPKKTFTKTWNAPGRHAPRAVKVKKAFQA